MLVHQRVCQLSHFIPFPMTDPAGAGLLMLTWLGYIDGIHGAPYIAAPWIRHGFLIQFFHQSLVFMGCSSEIGYHRSQPSQAIPGTLFPDLPRATKLERYPTRAEMFQRDEGMNSWLFDPQSSVNSELGMNELFSSLFTYLSERSLYPVRVNGVDSVWALCDSDELGEAGIKSLTGCLASSTENMIMLF